MNITHFTQLYPVSKTLRFKLIPEGKTLETFYNDHIFENDKVLKENHERVKTLLDNFYRDFIENIFADFSFDNDLLYEYQNLYLIRNKKEEEKENLESIIKKLKERIADIITNNSVKDLLSVKIFKNNNFLNFINNEELSFVKCFEKFGSYFSNYFESRNNIFTNENKSTEVIYRTINDNLPKFTDNISSYLKHKDLIDSFAEKITNSDSHIKDILYMFDIKNYGNFISQSGIDAYNAAIGGFVDADGNKIKGLNEYINEYNQQSNQKVPKFKMLFKQILSDKESIIKKFESDDDAINEIKIFEDNVKECLDNIYTLFLNMDPNKINEIFVDSKCFTNLSAKVTKDWNFINEHLINEYNFEHENSKKTSKYEENRDKYIKNIKSISLSKIQEFMSLSYNSDFRYKTIIEYINSELINLKNNIVETEVELKKADRSGNLLSDDFYIEKIKGYLDSIKNLQQFIKMFITETNGLGAEFYGDFLPLYDKLSNIIPLYNKVRNYVTQKPYSLNKLKLNFDCPTLLNGWDINKEADNKSIILRKDNKYYLAILKKDSKKSFDIPEPAANDEPCFEKMVYKLIPSAAKYFSSKQINPQNPPENIKKYISKDFDRKNMTKAQLVELIQYIVEDFIPNYDNLINPDTGKCYFNFKLKPYGEYKSWNEFCKEIDKQSYVLDFKKISESYVYNLVENGSIYLFRLYNKDFSEYSHGKKNLHTLYFLETFSEENIQNPIYKLNGEGELFFRPASLKVERPTHPKNEPIKNKNIYNNKKESIFEYDLIKNKRFTVDQFQLHISFSMNCNFDDESRRIREMVRNGLKSSKENYVIGIDRGERNLLYVSVIDSNGNIVEQFSGNVISNQDYHRLLDEKEQNRQKSRIDWKTIDGIKDLKQGYLSLIVNKICNLVEKYNAIIVMEDLNFGFKNTRSTIEKSVYQQFEKMLIDKLNFYVNKDLEKEVPGGIRNPYQLTEKFDTFRDIYNRKQSGIIFYVPAWNTSKIDPTTGFVNLFRFKYKNIDDSKNIISKFKNIKYENNMFEFAFNYNDFDGGSIDFKKDWTIYTNGTRVESYRDTTTLNKWATREIVLTNKFIDLFNDNDIDYMQVDLKSEILKKDRKADFYKEFFRLISLTCQLRNSVTDTDIDYILSPVKNKKGEFFDSRKLCSSLPLDADANGAYHIALKGKWLIEQIKASSDIMKVKLAISNAEWLRYTQEK